MKNIFKKCIVTILIFCMAFTQPLTLVAAEDFDLSDNAETPAVNAEETEPVSVDVETGFITDEIETSGTEENVTEEPNAEEYLTEEPEEVDAESEKNGVPEYNTVTDSFGNQYEYNISTWYKDYRNYDTDGYTYKIDQTNKKLILQGFNSQNDIVENLYIPATTTINNEVYTTRIPLNGYSIYPSPFCGEAGANKLKHLFIAPGVEVTNGSTDSTFGVFEDCKQLQSVDMTGVDFSKVKNLKNCFYDCSALRNVAFGENMGGITSMSSMFYGCTSLTEIDLTSLDTSSVQDASQMFRGCTSLKTADLSGLELLNATNLKYLFFNCTSLENIDLSGLELSEVTDMSYMFSGCHSLANFEFPDTDTSKCTTISNMFYDCPALKTLNLSKLDTDSLKNMSQMYTTVNPDLPALTMLCLPYGMECIETQYSLPLEMYHEGEKVSNGTNITPAMSGWILTLDHNQINISGPDITDPKSVTWKCIWFGHYFQYKYQPYMDKDPIKWRVLSFDQDTGEALLLSDCNIGYGAYQPEDIVVSWENSDIRKRLNSADPESGSFLRTAFSFAEKSAIIESDTDGCKDKVFLLSFEDMCNEDYGFTDQDLCNQNTNGEFTDPDWRRLSYDTEYCCPDYRNVWDPTCWFLRDRSYIVGDNGYIFKFDSPDYHLDYSIRPAIRLNLYEHRDLWSDAGTVKTTSRQQTFYSEPETKPDPIQYVESRWKFNNFRNDEAYGGFPNRVRHVITKSDYEYFINNLKPTEQDRFRAYIIDGRRFPDLAIDVALDDYDAITKKFKGWFGSCYGMSLTEGLYLDGRYAPPGYSTLGAVGSIAYSDNKDVESSINTYQFMENTDLASLHEWIKPSDVKSKAKAVQNSGDYFLISIGGFKDWEDEENGPSRHAILCLGGEECNIVCPEGTYTYRLKIYDPNSSIYDDDYYYMYISSDEKTAFIPQYCKSEEDINNMNMYSWTKSVADLSRFTDSDPSINDNWNIGIRSNMDIVKISAVTYGLTCVFAMGIAAPEVLFGGLAVVCFACRNGYTDGSKSAFEGGRYELGAVDPLEKYKVEGGEDDNLDAAFEYGDHTVSVYADTKGVSAEFSNGGDVKLQGMDPEGTGFVISNVYNEDYSEKPCQATQVCLSANAASDVEFRQSKEDGYVLTTGDGEEIKDVSVIIGTPLHSDEHKVADALGKITVSFPEGGVIVREDTNGDGVLDHEERFFDHEPVSEEEILQDAPDGIWIRGLEKEYTYTGAAIKPEFSVYRGKTRLYEKTDYTLKYTNNTKPGTAKITVTMKGNHSGKKDLNFKIVPASLETDITADAVYVLYKNNKAQKPKPVLYINGTKLKFGANDLTFTYPSEDENDKRAYVDPGTYKIHIAPKNAKLFTDETDIDLVIIDQALMSAVSLSASKSSLPYDNGNPVSPVFTLKYKGQPLTEGDDYTVSYADGHTEIGKHTVTFTGNGTQFFGTKSYTFSITGKYDLASALAEVTVDPQDLDEDGKALFTYGGAMPGMIVKYNGQKLTAGKDYTVSYKNHKVLGTATATVKGKGSYKGSVPVDFTVKERNINTLSLNLGDVLYTAKKDGFKKVPVIFVDENFKDQKLKAGTDYTLTFVGDYGDAPAAGTEIVVKIEGSGNYTGTIDNESYRIIDKTYDFTKAKVTVNGGKAYDYTGSEVKPLSQDLLVTLNNQSLNDENYEILGYYNNVRKGNGACIRLRGKGNYAGVKVVKFKIGAAPLDRIWSDVIIRLKSIFAP